MQHLSIPDIVPYLLAILGLLLVWEIHNLQVRAGRIKAVDILNRSGIRLFLHVTPDDPFACAACRETNATALLPAIVANKRFKASATPCLNPAGCRCLTIGLYGAWAEAQRIQTQLPRHEGRIQLSPEDFRKLLEGAALRRSGVAADQVSLAMLEAFRVEAANPDSAIERYRFVIDHAQTERDQALVVPAYIRLSELLDRTGRKTEALSVVDRFMKAYDGRTGRFKPSEAQVSVMSLRKTRLMIAQV